MFRTHRLLLLASLLSVFTALGASAQVSFPDSPAGKRLDEFLKLLDEGGPALDEFLSAGFETRDDATVQRRKMQVTQSQAQLGALTVTAVTATSDTEVTASCKAANGPVVDLTINVGSEPPHRIISVALAVGGSEPADDSPLTAERREAVITDLAAQLRGKYVYPEVAEEMATALEASLESGAYDKMTSARAFARQLTSELRDICHDKHLGISAGAPRRPGASPGRRPEDNFGFVKAEFLPGGIGYLKFNYFAGDDAAEPIAAAAMNFLARADALVFDLRDNGGGSPRMIAFLSGYLFDKRVHLNSFYHRPTDTTTETWTREDVPGNRFGESKPIYVLTSSHTFSGAEEFSYNLKNLKRGTIVGEVTGGGAHPVMSIRLEGNMSMRMPFARAINPVTKTNWEGVGVQPDVAVSADQALDKAVELAREAIANHRAAASPR